MKHTPGPWVSNKKTGIVTTTADHAVLQVHGQFSGGRFNEAETESNCELARSAPEMFDVLEKLVHGPAHKLYETVAEAHKILKRIKGEE